MLQNTCLLFCAYLLEFYGKIVYNEDNYKKSMDKCTNK